MARPEYLRIQDGGGAQRRNAESAGAPVRVSDGTNSSRNLTKSKYVRDFEISNQSRTLFADRPSTSGGAPTRRLFYKQETRDDLQCSALGANERNTTHYNFPLPTSILTPNATPGSSPPRPLSPEFLAQEPNYSHEVIGMALGSPTQQPLSWSPQVKYRAPMRRDSPDSLEEWIAASAPKSKSSKWKILGGLFGKKSPEPEPAFYQVQPETQNVHGSDYVAFPPLPPPEKTRSRGRMTAERKIENHKLDAKRSNTIPMDFQFQDSSNRPKEFPLVPPIQPPTIRVDQSPLLNVDIPSVEMERYSVMFCNVIKPDTSSSSLLARRQATLDKLKMVNDAIAEHERREAEAKSKLLRPRRATSPQPTKSPVMSLFPTPSRTPRDGVTYNPRKASPLHRSNTSPAALSPNRQTFEPIRPIYEEHHGKLSPIPASLRPVAALTSPWSPDKSFLSLNSPTSDISDDEHELVAPLRPRLKEPIWEMVAPSTMTYSRQRSQSVFPTGTDTQLPDLPRKQSLQSSLDALARVGAVEEVEEMIKSAADISIARQISVSRSQRQLLVPIKSRIACPTGFPDRESTSGAGDAPEGCERLVVNERKPMTPTLVNVKARRVVKSELVVLEGT